MGLSWRRVDSRAGLPESIVAILGGGPVYFSDQRRRTDFQLYTDRKIHVIRLRFGTATTGAHVNTIEADGIILAEAIFPNQLSWSAYKLPEWRWRNASEPLGDGYSLDFEKTAATKLAIGGGMTLTVKPTWRGDREVEQLRIPSGTVIRVARADRQVRRDVGMAPGPDRSRASVRPYLSQVRSLM
jgi:hypothetical protein